MAVDMGGESPTVTQRVGLIQLVEEHSYLFIGLAVAVVVFLLYKHSQSTTGTSATTSQQRDLSGLSTDVNGNPIVYVPTSTYFNTDNSVTANDNTAPVSIDSPTTTTTAPVVPPATGTPGTGGTRPPPIHPIQTLVVRSQRTGDASDLKNHGVAVRSSPGGKQIAVAPFGATEAIVGLNPIIGPGNGFKGGGTSSTSWYLIDAGYISAIDVASVS